MALDRLTDDLNIVGKLGDNPRTEDGLSTQGFKNKFDEAGLLIKSFINNILIPQIENSVDEGSLLSQITAALNKKLNLSGGTMTGPIYMNGQKLTGLNAPTANDEAATKGYVVGSFMPKFTTLPVSQGGTGAASAELARANLGITLENIGALSMELLWENASPTSHYGENSFDLPSLANYDMCYIESFRTESDNTISGRTVAYTDGTPSYLYGTSTGFSMIWRKVTLTKSTVAFTGYYSSSTENGNTNEIPYRIYGIGGLNT